MKQSRERPSLLYLYNRVGESKNFRPLTPLIPNYVLSRKTGFHYRKSSKIRDNFFIMASGGNHNESTDN